MSNASYKQRKEDFVSNLSGGDVGEIASASAAPLTAFLLWSVLQSRQSFFKHYGLLAFLVDYALNVGVVVLVMTLYSSQAVLLNLLLLGPAVLVYVLPVAAERKKKARVPPPSESNGGSKQLDLLPVKPFLTTYRATMMIATCVGILAVDFKLFPRRFAKVETWGTSLMDMGVGAFVFSGGVVAARPVLKERASRKAIPFVTRILSSLKHSLPLLVLGVIRLLSVKGLEYAEHVTEYGVHWNFFFTLAFLPPFVAASQGVLRIIPSYTAMSLIVGGVYQILLETTQLKAFILTAPRVDLISMNREGIFSFLGYLAIFLAGQDLGMLIIPRNINPRSNSDPGTQRNTLLMTIAVWAVIWSALYFFSTSYSYGFSLTVSRRLANLPYVLWVASFSSLQVFFTCLIDTVFFPAFYNAADGKTERKAHETATSVVMRSFNRNGLVIFLLANLWTGLINMTFNTLDATPIETMAILVGYTFVLTGVAVGLDMYNISIKI